MVTGGDGWEAFRQVLEVIIMQQYTEWMKMEARKESHS